MKKILLIEDDNELAGYLIQFLENEDFKVSHALGQTEGLKLFMKESFDCALVDISIKDGNGFSVCSEIKSKSDLPVIFLTANTDETSTVAGFEMGADDYINKPFRPRELIARIKNAVRRRKGNSQIIQCGDVVIDTSKGTVHKNGTEIFLSALEYRLLLVFFTNQGQLLSRDRLIDELWTVSGEFVSDNTLTVYIKRLREKIENDLQYPKIIKTVRGLGYKAGE